MSLDWSVANVKDHATVTTSPFDEHKWHPVTEAIVWACMAVELSGITEKNIDEFWFRYKAWQMVAGASLLNKDGDLYVTRKDVELHIGLSTNVSDQSRKYFMDKLVKVIENSTRFNRLSAHEKIAADAAKWKEEQELKSPEELASKIDR